MKIGSVAWGWTPTPEDMPTMGIIKQLTNDIAGLGFDIVDYLSTRESLDEFFTKEHCAEIRKYAHGLGLTVGGFVFQSDTWNNPCSDETKAQMHYFRKCAVAAADIGASAISCIIPRPFGGKPTRGNRSPSEKIASNLPPDYSWGADWQRFINNLGEACDIAAGHGLKIALECFPGSLCSTPHAMQRAIEDISRPNFGIQLDTAHLMNQHIDIETAVFMLGSENIFNVHIKDSDGLTRGNLPAGCGVVDYTAFFKALHNVGYDKNASIEVEFTDNPKRYFAQALSHVQLCLAGKY